MPVSLEMLTNESEDNVAPPLTRSKTASQIIACIRVLLGRPILDAGESAIVTYLTIHKCSVRSWEGDADLRNRDAPL